MSVPYVCSNGRFHHSATSTTTTCTKVNILHSDHRPICIVDENSNSIDGADNSEYILCHQVDAHAIENTSHVDQSFYIPHDQLIAMSDQDTVSEEDSSHDTTEEDELTNWINFLKRRLFANPRNRWCTYNATTKCFKFNNTKMRGVHNILSKVFYPFSTKELCQKNRSKTGSSSSSSTTPSGTTVDNEIDLFYTNNSCNVMDKKVHGSRVDEQLQKFTEIQARAQQEPNNDGAVDPIDLLKRHYGANCDPCVIRLLNEFKRRKWTILRTQFIVYNEILKIATAIDMICVDENYNLIIVELKTSTHGLSDYFEFSSGHIKHLSAPSKGLSKIPFSMYTSAMLQLTIAYYIIKSTYSSKAVKYAYVVRIGKNTIWFYEMAEWCYDVMPQIKNAIIAHDSMPKTKKKKTSVNQHRLPKPIASVQQSVPCSIKLNHNNQQKTTINLQDYG